MTISGIISISGRPGLFKVVAQGKNNIIVESLQDKKRFPTYASDRISALEDISIYTYSEDKPLSEIFDAIFKKEKGATCISHKESEDKLTGYLIEVLPDFDQERVYPSDIKKIFMWYNILNKVGELGKSDEKEEVVEEKPKAKAKKATAKDGDKEVKKAAKPKAKIAAKPKAAPKSKSAPKTSAPKKVAQPKSGAGRGK